VGFSALSLTDP